MIKITIYNNMLETDNVEGLCYYFSNNIKSDLENLDIPVEMYDINKKHYYLIADNKYLIDVTYSQFLPQENQKPINFKEFPAKVLESSNKGKEILGDLLSNGYHILQDDDYDIYLNSFKLRGKIK